jgi:cysteine desulfuration protein SufE
MSYYPKKLAAIISLFENLAESERRETLISYADQAKNHEPKEGEVFDFEDFRKDEECTDTVGIYLRMDENQKYYFKIKSIQN